MKTCLNCYGNCLEQYFFVVMWKILQKMLSSLPVLLYEASIFAPSPFISFF